MKTSYAKKSASSKSSAKNTTKTEFDLNQVITDKIIAKLQSGVVAWHKPWHCTGEAFNYVTKKPYRGINALLLGFEAVEQPYYMTFLQAKQMGGRIKAGAKSEIVVFWNFICQDKDGNKVAPSEAIGGDTRAKAYLKYYNVFNVADIEGINFEFPQREQKTEVEKISSCEQIIASMPNMPALKHGGAKASYSPSLDLVKMPENKHFDSAESYYSVLFHELTHSTGHPSRLDRKEITSHNPFGSKEYSKEELVAELGAAFLSSRAGIVNHTIDNSAAYIQSWLKKLQSDNKFIIDAAGKASKAVDYILGQHATNITEE